MQVALISCSRKKNNERSMVKDLYTSTLFKLSRLYVEQLGLDWYILSAKHGLLHPDTVIEPYDEVLHRMLKWDILKWNAQVENQLRETVGTDVELLVLAGSIYKGALKEWKVIDPLEGLQIGKREAKLRNLTK